MPNPAQQNPAQAETQNQEMKTLAELADEKWRKEHKKFEPQRRDVTEGLKRVKTKEDFFRWLNEEYTPWGQKPLIPNVPLPTGGGGIGLKSGEDPSTFDFLQQGAKDAQQQIAEARKRLAGEVEKNAVPSQWANEKGEFHDPTGAFKSLEEVEQFMESDEYLNRQMRRDPMPGEPGTEHLWQTDGGGGRGIDEDDGLYNWQRKRLEMQRGTQNPDREFPWMGNRIPIGGGDKEYWENRDMDYERRNF